MKKTLILALLLIAMFSLAQSQTSKSATIFSSSMNDIILIPSWSPWANAVDSSNKKYSSPFDISKYDSINCWVINSTSPSRGVVDLKTVLLVGFNTSTSAASPAISFATNDTTRVLCDSTVAKSTVMTFYGVGVQTNGATFGKLALTPYCLGAAATYCNHSNDILTYVLVCHKKQ
jgi:hypothetical protein